VTALVIGTIPLPGVDPLPPVALSRHVTDDATAAVVSPFLDSALERLASTPRAIVKLARPVRFVVDQYLGALRLGTRWSMFATPPVVDQYVKVRYYVGTSQIAGVIPRVTWTATELVLPAHREDQVRGLQSFRDSSEDKALAVALDDFHRKLNEYFDRTGHLPRELPDDLEPIARYFGRRFAREHLSTGEHLLRTEVWYGEVKNPVRGVALDTAVVDARLAALRRYYGGPVRGPASSYGTLAYGDSEKEADIEWTLKYFEGQ
jgi:hypothetical protein